MEAQNPHSAAWKSFCRFGPQDIPGTIVEGLTKYVPYLFLTPFFETETRGVVADCQNFGESVSWRKQASTNVMPPPYCFSDAGDILVHPKWREYIVRQWVYSQIVDLMALGAVRTKG